MNNQYNCVPSNMFAMTSSGKNRCFAIVTQFVNGGCPYWCGEYCIEPEFWYIVLIF